MRHEHEWMTAAVLRNPCARQPAQNAVQLQRGALAESDPTRVNEMRDKKWSGKN
jgi:hypothetical protein